MITEKNAKIVTSEIPGAKSRELFERRKNVVARGISYSNEVFVKEAKGALIKDVDDNIYVDFAAGIGVVNVGHCPGEVVDAIKAQSDKFIHSSFNVNMYELYVEMAEKLATLSPGNFPKKVMFANTGAEAVENAVKISRKYTGKTGVISLESAFHGRTFMTMSLTSKVMPYKDGFSPFASDTYKIPSAYCYRCPFGSSYPTCGIACAEKLRTMLKSELSPGIIAAMIVEPVQGEGGVIVQPKEFLKAIESICNENEIVFIMDEIQAGFARTGKLFACDNFGVQPDLITVSKSIAAGVPLSAVIGKTNIIDAPVPGSLGGTFSGNPLALAAGLKVLEIIERDKLADRAVEIGNRMKKRLIEMQEKYEIIGDVRGLGAMVGIELVKNRKTKEPAKEYIKKITDGCLARGVIIISSGILGNVIRFLPPLVITDDQLNYGLDTLEDVIKNL